MEATLLPKMVFPLTPDDLANSDMILKSECEKGITEGSNLCRPER